MIKRSSGKLTISEDACVCLCVLFCYHNHDDTILYSVRTLYYGIRYFPNLHLDLSSRSFIFARFYLINSINVRACYFTKSVTKQRALPTHFKYLLK